MTTTRKPEKVGNVWTAAETIWVIDDSGSVPVRKKLAVCIDTPNHIGTALESLRKAGHKNLWSTGEASGKEYHG
jgi:hypothetical protein